MPINRSDLLVLADERIKDAEALEKASRFDGAAYLCGYSIELFLKYRLCKQLKWVDFPMTSKEFSDLNSLKTHDLNTLLKFSGIEKLVRQRYFYEWSVLMQWNPQNRYDPIGKVTPNTVAEMISAAKKLMKHK